MATLNKLLKPLQLPPQFGEGKRVLCVGLGGGCDIITAYVVAKRLPGLSKDVAWANAKRNTSGLSAVTDDGHIWRVPHHNPLEAGVNTYGTCLIDASVPQGPHGSPLVLRIPYIAKSGQAMCDADRNAIEETLRSIGLAVASLGFDAVIGVDAGGDSVTGGIDHDGDPTLGTDQMTLRALQHSGLPLLMVVCGFGSDGESTAEQIKAAIEAEEAAGRVLGVVAMDAGWAADFAQMSAGLGQTRTPAIMAAALAASEANGTMVVDRGIRPTIPTALLSVAFVLAR